MKIIVVSRTTVEPLATSWTMTVTDSKACRAIIYGQLSRTIAYKVTHGGDGLRRVSRLPRRSAIRELETNHKQCAATCSKNDLSFVDFTPQVCATFMLICFFLQYRVRRLQYVLLHGEINRCNEHTSSTAF